jgi:nucleoid-associated protein YgaU
MGCVQPAVLEFDEEVQAPWRPRLVSELVADDAAVRPLRPHPSRRSGSRVGVCRPPESPAAPVRRAAPRSGARRVSPGAPARTRIVAPARTGGVGLRLTRRARRLAVVLALASGVAVGSWLAPLLSGGGEGDLRLAGVESVVVQPGDTLWSIATSLDGDGDVRAVVDEIQELNGLNGAALVPGQTLLLP